MLFGPIFFSFRQFLATKKVIANESHLLFCQIYMSEHKKQGDRSHPVARVSNVFTLQLSFR